jgi:hypothetical protein
MEMLGLARRASCLFHTRTAGKTRRVVAGTLADNTLPLPPPGPSLSLEYSGGPLPEAQGRLVDNRWNAIDLRECTS